MASIPSIPAPGYTTNTSNFRFSKLELTSTSNESAAELALAKAMMKRQISSFDQDVNSLSNKKLEVDYKLNDETGTHLMINHQMNELGTVFSLAAVHDLDDSNNTTGGSGAHLSFVSSSGKVGSTLAANSTNKTVNLTNDSASYYDSQVVVNTDNTEHIYYDPAGSTESRFEVTYDTDSSNYNAEKAVNSRYSTIGDSTGPSTNDPLTISESTSFNSSDSLFTEKLISRDLTTNQLSAGFGVTGAVTDATNVNGNYYYRAGGVTGGASLIGIDTSTTSTTSNDSVFFGAVKLVQPQDSDIGVTGVSVNSSSSTLVGVTGSDINGSNSSYNLPSNYTETQFVNLFTPNDYSYIGSGYSLGITGVAGGGYSTEFRGFTTNDNDVVRNTKYMRACQTEGNNFAASTHTIEIQNGDLVGVTGVNGNVGANANLIGTPYDDDEYLGPSEFTSSYSVKTYFTDIDAYDNTLGYPRATIADGSSSQYTSFKVFYDASEGPTGTTVTVLDNSRRSEYHDVFSIKSVFPSTLTADVSGNSINQTTNYVNSDNGFSAFLVNSGSNINSPSDYVFTSPYGATGNHFGANDVVLLKLNSSQKMCNENSLYVDGDTAPVSGTTVSAIGENINMSSLNGNDLRVKLSTKSSLSSTLSGSWIISLESGSNFAINATNPNIFGEDIYAITADTTTSIPLKFTVKTNSEASNRDALTTYLEIAYSMDNGETWKTSTLSESNILGDGYSSVNTITTDAIGHSLVSSVSTNVVLSDLLSKYTLKKNVETKRFTPKFHLSLGAYSNVQVTGEEIVVTTTYYHLENSSGARLADHYLSYYRLSGSVIKASRQFTGIYESQFNSSGLLSADLYGMTATIEKKNADNTWTPIAGPLDFDPAYNNFTVFQLGTVTDGVGADGTITLSADISNSNSTGLNSSTGVTLSAATHYIELSTANTAVSYSVAGYKWDMSRVQNYASDSAAQGLITWAETNWLDNSSVPQYSISINGLHASVEFTSPANNNMSLQPNVTIKVIDSSDNVWAQFETTNKNATSNFNIWYAARPVFNVVEYLGEETINYSMMADTATTLNIVDGIQLDFTGVIGSLGGVEATYTLKGDYLLASLYSGYAANYSSTTEVTPETGLTIGSDDTITNYQEAYVNKARQVDITYYRGNSVRTYASPATFEEFRWSRSTSYTTMFMKIVNSNVASYKANLHNLYNGSLYSVTILNQFNFDTNLAITPANDLGNLQLKFDSHRSRFSSTTSMSIPITITHGSYDWSITNPANSNNAGSILVKNGSGNVSTADYSVINYTGTNALNIVASRVMVKDNESYGFIYIVSDLELYYSEEFVGQPNGFTYDLEPFQTISYSDLLIGKNILVPNTTTDSIIKLSRANIGIVSHTAYFVLPRPQIVVDAVATKSVSALPFDLSITTKTSRYFDVNIQTNSHTPFAGTFGEETVSSLSTRVINDMTVKFNTENEKYTAMRLSSSSNSYPIYIPSNKITIDMYLGYPLDNEETLNDANKIVTVYTGYIHELSNYLIANGDYTEYEEGKQTYLDGAFNSTNGTYDLSFSQTPSVISPLVDDSVVYGELGNSIINIETVGYSPFMNVDTKHLDLLTGDSLKLRLYGHKFEYENNQLVLKLVRYTSATGIDFSNAAAAFVIKNLGFTASVRETKSILIRDNVNTLNSTPFNLLTDTADAVSTLNNTWWNTNAWTSDNDNGTWSAGALDVTFTSLSTVGQTILTGILGVTKRSPIRFLVCSCPPFVDIRSADGSPIYVVNAFGTLSNVRTLTHVVELSSSAIYTSSNIPAEYIAYNSLRGSAL